MSFVIREPLPADADALAALHVTTWRETYVHLLPADFFTDEYVERRRAMWRNGLERPHPDHVIRVADADGELIGFSWVGPDPDGGDDRPLLYAIYVLAAHHGSGVGQALLDAALGDGGAALWVAAENPRAIAFYERNGFAFDGAEQTDAATSGITERRMVR